MVNKFEILESKRIEEQAKWESHQRVRRQHEEKRRKLRNQKCIVIQRSIRMCLAEKKKRRMLHAIILIQSNQRSASKRKQWKVMKDSAIVIAKFVKARRARIIFREVRKMVKTIQRSGHLSTTEVYYGGFRSILYFQLNPPEIPLLKI